MAKVLALVETDTAGIKRTSLEVLTAAGAVGEALGSSVAAVLIAGPPEALSQAGVYGVPEGIVLQHELLGSYSMTGVAAAVAQLVEAEDAQIVLVAANARGKELAPRLAAKLRAGYASDCVELRPQQGQLLAIRPVYAGKVMATVRLRTARGVYSLRPNVFTARPLADGVETTIRSFRPELQPEDCTTIVERVIRTEGKLDVLEADIIVSGGRGMKGPEHFWMIEELAQLLGGAVGASRAVVDAGWRPHSEQVGQTGKTVSPSLYIACGISGAIQHLAGMSSSKVIVAVNKDPEAPIFKVADYGIVGDVFDVLPRLAVKLARFLGKPLPERFQHMVEQSN
ncbi:MAG: electron transfer flavoprotein subunit alpha/FixB family protein [Candidatus Kapabacteria bacterium]|nr:electron transfer flavoprotein subunit alpha/FixB family protein [Candidatus Kapabacteria bacterium]MDW8011760.1 electron transfer flavoprotein subunit alpha/FixB family protein [Bacteroidota bacterium]